MNPLYQGKFGYIDRVSIHRRYNNLKDFLKSIARDIGYYKKARRYG